MNDNRGFLTLNEYQTLAFATNKNTTVATLDVDACQGDEVDRIIPAMYNTLGMLGEAGEFAEKVKKNARDGVWDQVAAGKELGDVLWYVSQIARDIGYTLEEIAQMNLAKLKDRRERGVLKGSGDNR